jgi:hypothetical protein
MVNIGGFDKIDGQGKNKKWQFFARREKLEKLLGPLEKLFFDLIQI